MTEHRPGDLRKPEGTGEFDYGRLHEGRFPSLDDPITPRDVLRFSLGLILLGMLLGGLLVYFLNRRALAAPDEIPIEVGTIWLPALATITLVIREIFGEIKERRKIREERAAKEQQRKWELEDRDYKRNLARTAGELKSMVAENVAHAGELKTMVAENTSITVDAAAAAQTGTDCVEKIARLLKLRRGDVEALEAALENAKLQRRRDDDAATVESGNTEEGR